MLCDKLHLHLHLHVRVYVRVHVRVHVHVGDCRVAYSAVLKVLRSLSSKGKVLYEVP